MLCLVTRAKKSILLANNNLFLRVGIETTTIVAFTVTCLCHCAKQFSYHRNQILIHECVVQKSLYIIHNGGWQYLLKKNTCNCIKTFRIWLDRVRSSYSEMKVSVNAHIKPPLKPFGCQSQALTSSPCNVLGILTVNHLHHLPVYT